jgi:hypothetical protein
MGLSLHRGAAGPDVTRLQEMVMALGYPLPRWGADGHLGNETLDAVTRLLAAHAQGWVDDDRDLVSDAEMATLEALYAATQATVVLPGLAFFDRRDTAARQGCCGGRRAWAQITGITLHQTACDFGREKPERWDTLHAHVGSSREGNVFWVYDFDTVVWHGNELNGATVGLEMEGNYAGIAGDRSTAWQPGRGPLMVPTPELVTASQGAIRWICQVVAQHGGKVEHLYAHRQTAASRRADPGADLWQAVALPMLAELALSDGGPAFKIDNGRTIPEAWNPAYVGNGY